MPDFFLVKDIHDVITHAKFGDDRLRGLGVVAGQISASPIDFAGRPYNTLTLPCERVIPCCRCQSLCHYAVYNCRNFSDSYYYFAHMLSVLITFSGQLKDILFEATTVWFVRFLHRRGEDSGNVELGNQIKSNQIKYDFNNG